MDKIIRQILQIDAEAQKKMEEARQKREAFIAEIDKEAGEETEKLRSHSASKIEMIRKTEKEAAQENIAAIRKQADAQTAALSQVFAEKEPQWLDEILQAVFSA